eukprot:109124-Karenia_brevis.AAC.1
MKRVNLRASELPVKIEHGKIPSLQDVRRELYAQAQISKSVREPMVFKRLGCAELAPNRGQRQ